MAVQAAVGFLAVSSALQAVDAERPAVLRAPVR